MTGLGPDARTLIDFARHEDDPDEEARQRVGRRLMVKLALGTGTLAAGAGLTSNASGAGLAQAGGKALRAITSAKAAMVLSCAVTAGLAGWALVADRGVDAGTAPRIAQRGGAPTVPSSQPSHANETHQDESAGSTEPGAAACDGTLGSRGCEPPVSLRQTERRGSEDLGERPGTLGREPSQITTAAPAVPNSNSSHVSAPSAGHGDWAELRVRAGVRDELAAEAQALRAAQRALRAGDTARAVALLDLQEQRFSKGQLAEERAAARAMALCQGSDFADSRAELARFERRWPRSLLMARVRAACRATAPVPSQDEETAPQ